jgi:outer membrane protein OmpA-like peptidoglycan-associated protein
MRRIFLLVLCGFVMSTTYSQNDVQPRYSVSGGVLGSANLSEFRTKNNIDYKTQTNWGFGAWLNLPIASAFSIEPQLQYNVYQIKTSNTTADLLLYNGTIRYVSIPILLKLHAGDHFAFTLGPEFNFMTVLTDNDKLSAKDDYKKTNVGLSGGLEAFPHGRVVFFGRYVLGLTDLDNRENHSTNMEYKTSNIQLGLKLRLFGKKEAPYRAAEVVVPVRVDTDGDGLYDDEDKCPTVAGIAKYEGCPIPDSDNDGINDELDKCPNQAGTAKYEGCPIPDSDGDGINDEEDKCPNEAGTAQYNGCPVPDKDNDGINDADDKCPDIAGPASNKGCPEVPANVSKSLGMAGQGISFGTTNATLTPKSNASLDQVVAIMNENPGLRIRVEGHTDNRGDADANMKLSEDRAAAVKAYIVSKGISVDRVTSEGFGGTTPIADNNTTTGRTKNRRVEIKMVY